MQSPHNRLIVKPMEGPVFRRFMGSNDYKYKLGQENLWELYVEKSGPVPWIK
jgi:hypothetical protein